MGSTPEVGQIEPTPSTAVELHRISHSAKRLAMYADLSKHFLTMSTVLGAIWICKTGFVEIVASNPLQISALAKFAAAFQLNKWVGTFAAAAGGTAAMIQRHGKQRAIKKAAEFRRRLEANDPYSAGSGLTKTGQTPKEGNIQ